MKHLIAQTQSILVPKDKYPTEEQAIKYVESLGLNSRFKAHPHSTAHFFRFRQYNPLDQGKYYTKPVHGGGKLVEDYSINHP